MSYPSQKGMTILLNRERRCIWDLLLALKITPTSVKIEPGVTQSKSSFQIWYKWVYLRMTEWMLKQSTELRRRCFWTWKTKSIPSERVFKINRRNYQMYIRDASEIVFTFGSAVLHCLYTVWDFCDLFLIWFISHSRKTYHLLLEGLFTEVWSPVPHRTTALHPLRLKRHSQEITDVASGANWKLQTHNDQARCWPLHHQGSIHLRPLRYSYCHQRILIYTKESKNLNSTYTEAESNQQLVIGSPLMAECTKTTKIQFQSPEKVLFFNL